MERGHNLAAENRVYRVCGIDCMPPFEVVLDDGVRMEAHAVQQTMMHRQDLHHN